MQAVSQGQFGAVYGWAANREVRADGAGPQVTTTAE